MKFNNFEVIMFNGMVRNISDDNTFIKVENEIGIVIYQTDEEIVIRTSEIDSYKRVQIKDLEIIARQSYSDNIDYDDNLKDNKLLNEIYKTEEEIKVSGKFIITIQYYNKNSKKVENQKIIMEAEKPIECVYRGIYSAELKGHDKILLSTSKGGNISKNIYLTKESVLERKNKIIRPDPTCFNENYTEKMLCNLINFQDKGQVLSEEEINILKKMQDRVNRLMKDKYGRLNSEMD